MTFDPDDANDITVQLRKTKTLAAIRSVFRVETTDDRVLFGRLYPDTIRGVVNLFGLADSATLFVEELSVVYPFHKSSWERFDGSIGLGYSYSRSSNFGRLNWDGTLIFKTRNDEYTLNTSAIYTITDTSFSRDREEAFFKYNHFFSAEWFYTGMLGYQRNLELGLATRLQEGVGIGNKFLTNKNMYSWARLGMVLNQEKNLEGVKSGTLAEVYGQMEVNFFRFTKPEISFQIIQSFYYSLSQKGRFRSDGESTITWKVFTDFKLNLSFYHNFDSKPPGEQGRNTDLGVIFGLSYIF